MRPVSSPFVQGSAPIRRAARAVVLLTFSPILLGLFTDRAQALPDPRPSGIGSSESRQATLAQVGFDSLTILVGGFELTGQAQMIQGKPPAEVWARLSDAEGRFQLLAPDLDPSQVGSVALYQDMGGGAELALDLLLGQPEGGAASAHLPALGQRSSISAPASLPSSFR